MFYIRVSIRLIFYMELGLADGRGKQTVWCEMILVWVSRIYIYIQWGVRVLKSVPTGLKT
jgi:hypothetical protein